MMAFLTHGSPLGSPFHLLPGSREPQTYLGLEISAIF